MVPHRDRIESHHRGPGSPVHQNSQGLTQNEMVLRPQCTAYGLRSERQTSEGAKVCGQGPCLVGRGLA